MSARLARSAFQSATRRAQTTVSSSAARVSRRAMSSTSGGAKSSDTPWIIGASLVFGPAFLYLVSPSARKNQHGIHNDHKEYPTLKHNADAPKHDEPVELMKDDEGTEANVGASIALSEGSDVPKDSQSPEKQAELHTDAETAAVPEEKSETGDAQEEDGHKHTPKAGTYQKEGEHGPVDQEVAQEGAKKGVLPIDNAKGEDV
ncbi:hypothetical protein CVT25_004176 [Psilocybe cyanescens]|uniref:Uncharacterized protein n=1 Tax=Psilocybe cyanescens TaxID=93625 RepID=A0A409X337_PSICY|nr:hypothetical protein CVT25_004176 [Psilocybe cyanescens]